MRLGAETPPAGSAGAPMPDNILKAATAPDAREVAAMDAMRLLDQRGDIDVPIGVEIAADGTERVVKRKLSEIMAEADDEIAAAKSLKGCALGREAAE
jgi:hypothetical protein